MPWDKFSGGNSSFAAQFMRTTVAKIKGGGGGNFIETPYWMHPVEQVQAQYMSVPPHRKISDAWNYSTNTPKGETTPYYGSYHPGVASGRTEVRSHFWGGSSQDRYYGKCDDHILAAGKQINWQAGFRLAVACAQGSTGSDQSIDISCQVYSATANPTISNLTLAGPRAWMLYNGRTGPCNYGMGTTNGSAVQGSYLNTSSASLSRYWCLMQAEFPAGMNGTGKFYLKVPDWVNGVFTGSNVLSHTVTFNDAFSGVTDPLDGSYVLIKKYNGSVRHYATWIGSLTDPWPYFDPAA